MPGIQIILVVDDGPAAIPFYVAAFGGICDFQQMADDGKRVLNAQISCFGTRLMVMDDFPEYQAPNGAVSLTPKAAGGATSMGHMPLDTKAEVDAALARAASAGALVTMAAQDMFWGDYYGSIIDPFGHQWSFGAPSKAPA